MKTLKRTRPTRKLMVQRGFSGWTATAILLAAMGALLPGCSILKTPQRVVYAVVPTTDRSDVSDPMRVQLQVQRFTDDFAGRTTQALDDYARQLDTQQSYITALRLKLLSVSAMTSIASGPNPNINLLDLVSATTLTRMMIEDYWLKTPGGAAFQSWHKNSKVLETNAWSLAATILKPSQLEELRNGIRLWYEQNPELRDGFLARPHEFASLVRSEGVRSGGVNNVFGWVGLDPTAGLDPAVREVTRTRLFAERSMFTLQRMPFLIRWQAELLAYDLTGLPEVRQVLTNTTRLSESAERISQIAAELPDRITAERQAILATLDQQEGNLRALAAEVNQTLVAGEKMSGSLNITLTTFDGLMKRFGVGESDTNSVPSTNSLPFNILDYGKVADQIGSMSKELNTLLTSANQNVTQLTRLSEEATAKVDRAVDRAFYRGVALILIFLVGTVLAGLTYRSLARKVARE